MRETTNCYCVAAAAAVVGIQSEEEAGMNVVSVDDHPSIYWESQQPAIVPFIRGWGLLYITTGVRGSGGSDDKTAAEVATAAKESNLSWQQPTRRRQRRRRRSGGRNAEETERA